MGCETWHGAGMPKAKFSFPAAVLRTRRTCETIFKLFFLWMQIQWQYTGMSTLNLVQFDLTKQFKYKERLFFKKNKKTKQNITFPILPFSHSSSQGSAWQDQFLAQRPQRAWSSTYTLEMFCDCTARHCWTSARCHPHTARDPGTDLQPEKWMKGYGRFSRVQLNPLQNEQRLFNSQCSDGVTLSV